MTTALAESRVQMDTCCWALWSPATDRKAPKTGHARSGGSQRERQGAAILGSEPKSNNPVLCSTHHSVPNLQEKFKLISKSLVNEKDLWLSGTPPTPDPLLLNGGKQLC